MELDAEDLRTCDAITQESFNRATVNTKPEEYFPFERITTMVI